MLGLALLAASGWASPACAQDTAAIVLEGYVVDAERGTPLPNAHVFIAGTLTGTVTDSTGRYRLRGVPRGVNNLYASMLGYHSEQRTLLLSRSGRHAVSFRLEPNVLPAGAVTVTATRDRTWQRRFDRFREGFLGATDSADSCRILNPEVLRFRESEGRLTASAVAPIRIENRALGYRLRYHLEAFSTSTDRTKYLGTARFDSLSAPNAQVQSRWTQNRRQAYLGSFRHFVQSLLFGRAEAAGFRASTPVGYRWQRADLPSLLRGGPSSNVKRLEVTGKLLIEYRDREQSRLDVQTAPVLVDIWGRLVHPDRVVFRGDMAQQRVANLLPIEYQPSVDGRLP
jgi:hypothetical protein